MMASPLKLSLEQRLAQQLRLGSTEDSEEGATTSTPAAAIPSRHLELAPHNVRVRAYLKENNVTFYHLNELKEEVLKPPPDSYRAC